MKRIIAVFLLLALLPGRALAAGLEIEGKSACLMDITTGTVLYEKNSTEPLAPASVTKIMTMLLIMEAIDSGALNWEDPVTASAAAAAKGGSQVFLKEGETMTVRDMLKSIAVSSANDCACAMAEHLAGSEGAFVERMNQRAQELGMKNTHFVNCTGLDDSPEAVNHRTSAGDIAIMSRELLLNHPAITEFTTIWTDTIRNGEFGLANTNKLVRFYNGATGLKTGFTSGAGYCLSATAQRDGLSLVAVVMGSDTSAQRFGSCKALLDYGFAGYAIYTPEPETVAPVPVTLGKTDSVNAVLQDNGGLLIEKSKKSAITTELSLCDSLKAPVAKGQPLGTLTVKAGDEVLAQLPLVAQCDVPRLTLLDIFLWILHTIAMGPPKRNAVLSDS